MAMPFARSHDSNLFSGILTGRYRRFPIRNRGVPPHFPPFSPRFRSISSQRTRNGAENPGEYLPQAQGRSDWVNAVGLASWLYPLTPAFFTSLSLISRPQRR